MKVPSHQQTTSTSSTSFCCLLLLLPAAAHMPCCGSCRSSSLSETISLPVCGICHALNLLQTSLPLCLCAHCPDDTSTHTTPTSGGPCAIQRQQAHAHTAKLPQRQLQALLPMPYSHIVPQGTLLLFACACATVTVHDSSTATATNCRLHTSHTGTPSSRAYCRTPSAATQRRRSSSTCRLRRTMRTRRPARCASAPALSAYATPLLSMRRALSAS